MNQLSVDVKVISSDDIYEFACFCNSITIYCKMVGRRLSVLLCRTMKSEGIPDPLMHVRAVRPKHGVNDLNIGF